MLEQMRRQGASIFIYFIFTLLIVIFVINFAPSNNRGGLEGGCGSSTNIAVTVDGAPANHTAFLVAHQGAGNFFRGVNGKQRVYLALDYLIRRELLAQAAAEQGIRTNIDLAREAVKQGQFFLGGTRLNLRPYYFDSVGDETFYNHKKWKSWVSSLNVSESSYLEEQARSLQAAMMADLLSGSVRVSREEALADYLYERNTVTYDVVAFDPAKYRPAMRLTDGDIKRFVDGHTAEVEARYKADERLYKGVKPQLALRVLYIPKATSPAGGSDDDKAGKPAAPPADKAGAAKPDEKKSEPATAQAAAKTDDKTGAAKPDDKKAEGAKPDDKKAAGTKTADAKPETVERKAESIKPGDKNPEPIKTGDKKPGAGAPPKPFGLPIDVAKAKLETVRAQIAAGKLTFPDAEKQLAADASDDAPATNGDRGWRSAENPELDDKAVNDAVKTLKPGEMTPVITTEAGVYLVIATDKREGDLSFDQVKNEIAADLAKTVWAKEAAKRDALDALAKATTSGKTLDQLFDRELVKPNQTLEDMLENPSLPPEQRQQIEEFLKRQKHGSLDVREVDVPVAWAAEADGSGGSAAAPAGGTPAAGGAAAPAPAAGGATAASGSAPPPASGSTGAAAPPAGGTAGSATPPAGTTPAPAAPAAPVVVEANKDVLPQFGTVPKPKVNRLGPSPRQPRMPGIGGTKPAIDALFDDLAAGNLAKQVYEGDGGSYVVLQLVNRAQPNADEFDKISSNELLQMRDARGRAALRDWLKTRCEALAKAGKIKPAADRIRETDDKGNPAPTVYRPCMYFDYLDR
jgi:SurA N-terminal domain/PPIC-type PPIASE domain